MKYCRKSLVSSIILFLIASNCFAQNLSENIKGTFVKVDTTENYKSFWEVVQKKSGIKNFRPNDYTFKFSLDSKKILELTISNSDSTVSIIRLKGRLKNEEFKLRTKFGVNGVPLILWALIWDKIRISVNEDRNIIIWNNHNGLGLITLMPVFGTDHDEKIILERL